MALGEGLRESLRTVNDVKLQMFEERLTLEAIRAKSGYPKINLRRREPMRFKKSSLRCRFQEK